MQENIIKPTNAYNTALSALQEEDYITAYETFDDLGDFKDSEEQKNAIETDYQAALYQLDEKRYNSALAALNRKEYTTAYDIFDRLGDFKDSEAQKNAIIPKYQAFLISQADIDSEVTFGEYEQDNDTANGKEPIEWFVLAREENKTLLISKYILDGQPYNTTDTEVTWETCTLRQWLNTTFYNDAFDANAQERIVSSTVAAERNPYADPEQEAIIGSDTTDKVFLLSISEVDKYYPIGGQLETSDVNWIATRPTDFARETYYPEGYSNESWWLRTRAVSYGRQDNKRAAIVSPYGTFGEYDSKDVTSITGVRPAIWIAPEA